MSDTDKKSKKSSEKQSNDTPEKKTYINKHTYTLKDGTTVTRDIVRSYIPSGRGPGKPKAIQTIFIAEFNCLSDKNKNKTFKYMQKLKARENQEEE